MFLMWAVSVTANVVQYSQNCYSTQPLLQLSLFRHKKYSQLFRIATHFESVFAFVFYNELSQSPQIDSHLHLIQTIHFL